MPGKQEISCLPLDSPRWPQLSHAYGQASDIPSLIHALEASPSPEHANEPWHSIWSALAHQGDVYSASFAAVPHVVRILAMDPLAADPTYFQFPAIVEAWRQNKHVTVPADLEDDYSAALSRLPSLIAQAATRHWDQDFLACALAALAAAKGYGNVAEAVIEMNPEVADEFMEWFFSR